MVNRPQRRSLPRTPPDDAPVGPLVDYLRGRQVIVFDGQDDLARNEAFEHLARQIGQHFDKVAPFYEKLKRCVAMGHMARVDIEGWSEAERAAAVQLGKTLHRHGLLKDFYYHRTPKKQLRVIPTKDGETAQFLTGGWLEIYVSWLLSRKLKARMSPAKFQVLFNIKGLLPDDREFEADLMAWVDGRLLWMECKTGHWQDYGTRFRGLVKTFGCDRKSAGLLLLKPPDSSTRARTTDMHEMTLLSMDEISPFLNQFLGVEETEIEEAQSEEDMAEALELPFGRPAEQLEEEEEEVPLENLEPARKLGKIELATEDLQAASPLQRRRRRRGGRGRGRGRLAADESAQASLLEALPILAEPEEQATLVETSGEAHSGEERQIESRPQRARPAPPSLREEETAAPVETASPAPAGRSRRRRRASPFAEEPSGDAAPFGAAAAPRAARLEPEAPDLAGQAGGREPEPEPVDAMTESASPQEDREDRPARRRRRRRRSASSPAPGEAQEGAPSAQGALAEKEEEENEPRDVAEPEPVAAAVESAAPAPEPSRPEPPRPRQRRGRSSTPSSQAEDSPGGPEEAAPPRAEPAVSAARPAAAAAEPKAQSAPAARAEAREAAEKKTWERGGPKKSASGVTIAPDFSAMLARPKPPPRSDE